ncbi:class I SAM-dependent methyltransferase [Tsukamurella sp. 8F]|uniref:class I SAM-dependent methyltransferase n=1 Tax=unclassified Tsukamurella TaxID=2633480 RepID=UPI0023B8C9B1|nr:MULTISPECIES: class I SAM-dependent methyltransferase [unclassified Tsukamurella]MDF0530147.1 class I SAM-dependent methyltransferase [Tsukamurella sp. 8J]MDF0586465.1 class I SAM-dependent methyltransferase [Tsukamurella sp. 8F]
MAEPRWITDTKPGHSEWYIERFRKMAAGGADLDGEGRLIDAMVPRNAKILDAGCGPGRVGGYLHSRGHTVTGVDVDPKLIEAAEQDHPGPRWLVGDLAELDLGERFDAIVCAGNVMVFVAEGTETRVLQRFRDHLTQDGFAVVGFHVDRGLTPQRFDAYAEQAGLRIDLRLATWDVKPWHEGADFAVSVLRPSDL